MVPSGRWTAYRSRWPRARCSDSSVPNGAGKTTTIKMLTTLLLPTSGECKVCGYDAVKHPTEVRQSIGLVPQELTVDDDLTGRENMMLQATLYGVERRWPRKGSTSC